MPRATGKNRSLSGCFLGLLEKEVGHGRRDAGSSAAHRGRRRRSRSHCSLLQNSVARVRVPLGESSRVAVSSLTMPRNTSAAPPAAAGAVSAQGHPQEGQQRRLARAPGPPRRAPSAPAPGRRAGSPAPAAGTAAHRPRSAAPGSGRCGQHPDGDGHERQRHHDPGHGAGDVVGSSRDLLNQPRTPHGQLGHGERDQGGERGAGEAVDQGLQQGRQELLRAPRLRRRRRRSQRSTEVSGSAEGQPGERDQGQLGGELVGAQRQAQARAWAPEPILAYRARAAAAASSDSRTGSRTPARWRACSRRCR